MNLSTIKNLVTSKAGRQILVLQKNSPTLLFGAGVVGVVATVALACRATLKVESVLYDHEKDMQRLDDVSDHLGGDEKVLQAKALIYTKTTVNLTKLYGPAFLVGVGSIACLTGSHHIMSQRNASLMAAYKVLEKGYEQYRKRVVDDLGADKDREYRFGSTDVEIVEETDKGQKITHIKRMDQDGLPSPYGRLFDQSSTSWNDRPDYNVVFLRCQQSYLNDKLRARGHVFLNEVYDALGLDRSKEGAVVGWIWNGDGDNYIDFGLFDKEMKPENFDFFTGRENAVWLDFNVDGVVYDKI